MNSDAVPLPSRRERLSWRTLLPWLHPLPIEGQRRLGRLGLLGTWWTTRTPERTFALIPRDRLAKALAEIVLDLQDSTEFEKLFAHLPQRRLLADLPSLPTRARNALSRTGARTVGELSGHSAATIANLPGVGRLTVVETVASLIDVSTWGDLQEPTPLGAQPPRAASPSQPTQSASVVGATSDSTTSAGITDPVLAQLVEDLGAVARWRQLRGDPSSPVLQDTVDETAPGEVQQAQERLAALCAADLLSAEAMPDPVQELEDAFVHLSPRDLLVLKRRFFAAQPETLAAIGRELGITREGVRQVEVRVQPQLVPHTRFGTAAGDLLAVIRSEIRPVASLRRLVEMHTVLERTVAAIGVPLWLALDRLDDAFEVEDGWAAAPNVAEAVERTRRLLEDLDDRYGLVPLDDAVASLGDSLTPREAEEWLAYCGYELYERHVLTRTRSIPDRAAAVLAIAGQPLTLADVVERLGVDRSASSCRNALAIDPRVARVGRDEWALVEWGLEGYTSIRDAIGQAVDAAGGEVPLGALTEMLVGRYAVAPTSVTTYASAAPYELRGGVVRRQTRAAVPRKDPCDTRRLFRHEDGWRYRLVVTSDHLRGSGFPVPVGIATLIGCSPSGTVSLDSRLGPQPFRWTGLQPAVSTIRRFLHDLSVGDGATVFLWFGDDRRFDVQAGPDPDGFSDPLVRALAMVGVDKPEQHQAPLRTLASAVCLPQTADALTVLGAYRDRGDRGIAELLMAGWDRLRASGSASSDHQPEPPEGSVTADDVMKMLGYD